MLSAGVRMQREMVRAQRAGLDAAQTMLDAGRQLTALQDAGAKAAEANLAMWTQWAKLWGAK